jgi:NAD(P)-dependent dehydrogenase (short-subunit alcohol dehydrogenase family)
MAGELAGRVALISGGASGIGAAAAHVMAREGAAVAVADFDARRAGEVAEGVASHEQVNQLMVDCFRLPVGPFAMVQGATTGWKK